MPCPVSCEGEEEEEKGGGGGGGGGGGEGKVEKNDNMNPMFKPSTNLIDSHCRHFGSDLVGKRGWEIELSQSTTIRCMS